MTILLSLVWCLWIRSEPTEWRNFQVLHSRIESSSYPQTLDWVRKDCLGQKLQLITNYGRKNVLWHWSQVSRLLGQNDFWLWRHFRFRPVFQVLQRFGQAPDLNAGPVLVTTRRRQVVGDVRRNKVQVKPDVILTEKITFDHGQTLAYRMSLGPSFQL